MLPNWSALIKGKPIDQARICKFYVNLIDIFNQVGTVACGRGLIMITA